jgi:hypothetical protein
MRTRTRWLLVVGLGATGLVVGLLRALSHPAKYGRDHSCPPGASRASCTYRPELAQQRTGWSFAGLLIGLALGGIVTVAVSPPLD